MSYVYRQEHRANADVLDPRWWNLNQSELLGEFNGGLDRDNMPPNVVTEAMCGSKVFLDADSSILNGTWAPDPLVVTWQAFNPTGGGGTVPVNAAVDACLEIDFSASWSWNGAYSQAASGATFTVDTVSVRVLLNGVTVAESGPSEDKADRDNVAILGTIPVGPGDYEVTVEVMVTRLEYEGLDATGSCTNTCTFDAASLVVVERRR